MIDGRKLRAFREKRGVTQAAVARELGIKKQSLTTKERRPNGPEAAEAYLNAVLKLIGRRERVFFTLGVSVPMGGMHTDLYEELQGMVE
jgi:transcriptional regulator with XRE-family HTH domain